MGWGGEKKKTINGSLTEFLYDGENPVQETAGAMVLANILPGLDIDEFLTRTDVVAGVTSNFLTGALGSPVAVTDNTGTVQTEYTYEAFGRTTATGASNSSSYQYTGRENDGTGLYDYRARYFDPTLQRFIREDPIGFAGRDYNLFAYVKNNLLTKRDPLGLAPCGNDKDCLRKFFECMAHAWETEIKCMALVAAGAATCVAGAGLGLYCCWTGLCGLLCCVFSAMRCCSSSRI